MRRWLFLLLPAVLLFGLQTSAQTITTVSGTITDPNGLPYSNATISFTLLPPSGGGATPSLTPCSAGAGQCPVIPPTQAFTNGLGSFVVPLPANGSITPAGTTWQFTISTPGIPLPFGTGSQKIVYATTISGSSQSLSSALSAIATAQTVAFGGGSGNPCTVTAHSVQYNNGGAFGCMTDFTYDGSHTFTIGAAGILTLTAGAAVNGITEAMLPAATVFTDQNATFGAHTYDFSGVTLMKARVGAGATTSANGDFVFDSMNLNWHFWNGADVIMAPLASGFTSGHCGQPTLTGNKWTIADAGAACGSGSMVYPGAGMALSSGSAWNTSVNYLSTLTGQSLTSTNGAAPAFTSPGVLDGNGGSPVTSANYPIACDNTTTLLDRVHILRFKSGASAPVIPLSTATGCGGGFTVTVIDDGAGALTFGATSTDTLSIFNGSTAADGATTFTLQNGQYATLTQGAAGIWEVRITGTQAILGATYATVTNCAAVGSAASPSVASCSAAPSGAFSCATNASTGTCVIDTTAVTANSNIFIQPTAAAGTRLSVTCNTSSDTGVTAPRLASISAGTSFTINLGTFGTNPLCFNYWVVN